MKKNYFPKPLRYIIFTITIIVIALTFAAIYYTTPGPKKEVPENDILIDTLSAGITLSKGEESAIPNPQPYCNGLIQNLGQGRIYFTDCLRCDNATKINLDLSTITKGPVVFPRPSINGKNIMVDLIENDDIRVYLSH